MGVLLRKSPLRVSHTPQFPSPWIFLHKHIQWSSTLKYLSGKAVAWCLAAGQRWCLRVLPFSSRVTLAYTTLPTSRNLSFRSCQEVLKLKFEMKHRFLNSTQRIHTPAGTTEIAATACPADPESRSPTACCTPAAFTRTSSSKRESEARLWPVKILTDHAAVNPSQLSSAAENGVHAGQRPIRSTIISV